MSYKPNGILSVPKTKMDRNNTQNKTKNHNIAVRYLGYVFQKSNSLGI